MKGVLKGLKTVNGNNTEDDADFFKHPKMYSEYAGMPGRYRCPNRADENDGRYA